MTKPTMPAPESGPAARLRDLYRAALVRHRLRGCNHVGARPLVRGAPEIANYGSITIGDDLDWISVPVRSHLFVGGRLTIGDRVRIGAGTSISCLGEMNIGSDVSIGAFTILLDSDFHVAHARHEAAAARPIRIERGVQLGHRVVVLPGSTIGAGAIVRPGSVVSGEISAGAVVVGNPARPEGASAAVDGGGDPREVVPAIVARVLGLSAPPDVSAGPDHLRGWDSLGTLRLILALEDAFRITLSEDRVKNARSVRELIGCVDAELTRKQEPLRA